MEQASTTTIDIHEIRRLLPHRYPMLLVDRVLECVPGEYLVAVKNVTVNEPHFNGHFPQRPVMPGVLIIEALAQACGLFAFATEGASPEGENLFYLVGVDKARFKRPVEPGDQLVMRVEHVKTRSGVWIFNGEARVDGKVAASAEIRCTMRGA
ncbi:3-hydroxyacyl-ACP dehydratase FabZ [Alkalilimnicola sp. S0819]|uniref:3-hydroxyacyl-ACP dehydratase FabZ n=1 Tax=Alkalilimnicola sp. S0819 TaxID=2613922 RepID=UPI001262A662|nr:3-hydroxyacyl-ACP dehydratase FabZ [Alkalilimnicola sp. S0819]KAB7627926.1 3-hydroxyacyl-ACP dehydratase FabZ [Alkalilimnicola sp. S0819]MPQ15563.1 3-hydroxyacyl-ACP dehydratase FabZ [Alkalilimnicola sp. S0819]